MTKEILFLVNLISYNALKKITIKISQLLLYIYFWLILKFLCTTFLLIIKFTSGLTFNMNSYESEPVR